MSSSKSLEQLPNCSLADLAYESVLESILAGRLPIGTELTTARLAQELDISRTPVTEALQRLVADRLVHWPKGRKARVASFTAEDIGQIFQLRRQLEVLSAELSAQHMPSMIAAELLDESKAVSQSRELVDWSSRCIRLDVRIHEAIAEYSGNRWLEDDIYRILRLVRVMFRFTASEETLSIAVEQHIAVLKAIVDKNPAAARVAMEAHIDSSREMTLDAYEAYTAARIQ